MKPKPKVGDSVLVVLQPVTGTVEKVGRKYFTVSWAYNSSDIRIQKEFPLADWRPIGRCGPDEDDEYNLEAKIGEGCSGGEKF